MANVESVKYFSDLITSSHTYIDVLVVYKEKELIWMLSPKEYPLKKLHHHKVVGSTLILSTVSEGLYFYDIEKQEQIGYVEYPATFEQSTIACESYAQDNTLVMLDGELRGEEEYENVLLIIDIEKMSLVKEAYNINKESYSFAAFNKKNNIWSVVDREYTKFGTECNILELGMEEDDYIVRKCLHQAANDNKADTWISPSGELVVRTCYQGAEIVEREGEPYLRHYVELFHSNNTAKVEKILTREIHYHNVGYLHAPPKEDDEDERELEWREIWEMLKLSKSAYRTFNFAKHSPKIHRPIRALWNKRYSSYADEYNTPLERITEAVNEVHNDLYGVVWEEDEKAFWVIFRGGIIRRVALDGALSSIFIYQESHNNTAPFFNCMNHLKSIKIDSEGVITVQRNHYTDYVGFDTRFRFDTKAFDYSDPNKVILLEKELLLNWQPFVSEEDRRTVDAFMSQSFDTEIVCASGEPKDIEIAFAKLQKILTGDINKLVYRNQINIVFVVDGERFYESEFFKKFVTSHELVDALKILLESYLDQLAKEKKRFYCDEETQVLGYAFECWINLTMDSEKFISNEIVELVVLWMKVNSSSYMIDDVFSKLLKHYSLDANWLRVKFWEILPNYYLHESFDVEKVEEHFSTEELVTLFKRYFDELWEFSILKRIKNDPYDKPLEGLEGTALVSNVEALKEERFRKEIELVNFSDEVKALLLEIEH